MNASRHAWVIYFVGFDETPAAESYVVPYVGRERVEASEELEEVHAAAELAALMRGGRVVALVADDEIHAERTRAAIEEEILPCR
jgi:hypothetical protein